MQLIFFSDLDGTLLDHKTYDFNPALPALRMLKRLDIPLVLASSKTGAEIASLRASIGMQQWPAIVENGAGELAPGTVVSNDALEYRKLRESLTRLPQSLRGMFRGFGDMSDIEVAKLTGLSIEAAELARKRSYTEPGLFDGTAVAKQEFCEALSEFGIRANEGGRFMTLSFGRTKADGLVDIARRFGADVTVALGDAPNDREMLRVATQAVIIRNDDAPDIGDIPGAILSTQSGPYGWNVVVLELLQTYGFKTEK